MSNPTDNPTPQPIQVAPDAVVVDEAVAKTAIRVTRAKTFLKSTFKNVGVPVLIGSAAAFVATRRTSNSDELDSDSSDDTSTDQ